MRARFRCRDSLAEDSTTAKTAALVIGIVFILVGILGFIPNPIVSPDGIFVVDTMHNLVHLISGIVLLAGAYGFGASLALKIVGIVYAIVAVLGFFLVGDDGMMLGLIQVNEADLCRAQDYVELPACCF